MYKPSLGAIIKVIRLEYEVSYSFVDSEGSLVTGTSSIWIKEPSSNFCDSLEVTYSQTSLSTLLGNIVTLTPTIKVRDGRNHYL